jgi:hypothetical protein
VYPSLPIAYVAEQQSENTKVLIQYLKIAFHMRVEFWAISESFDFGS